MAISRGKMTFFFKSSGQGWTESWYVRDVVDYDALLKLGKDYAPLRAALLGIGGSLEYVRISDDEVKRETLVYQCPVKDGTSSYFVDSTKDRIDQGWMRALLRCEGTPFYRKSWMLAGLPDRVFDRSWANGLDPTTGWIAPLNNLVTYIKAKQFGFKAMGKAPNPLIVDTRPVTAVIPLRAASRRVGRPFDSPVGRRV